MIWSFRAWAFRAWSLRSIFGTISNGPFHATYSVGFAAGPEHSEAASPCTYAAALPTGPSHSEGAPL